MTHDNGMSLKVGMTTMMMTTIIIIQLRTGPYPEKNFGGGFGNEAPKSPRTSRRRRRDRDAERVEGGGNGEGVSPSPVD